MRIDPEMAHYGGRSMAVFGRAHVLAESGRCDEARPAFQEYITIVQNNRWRGGIAATAVHPTVCRPRPRRRHARRAALGPELGPRAIGTTAKRTSLDREKK